MVAIGLSTEVLSFYPFLGGVYETLADEPTGNLDGDTAGEITGILKESAYELNKCVIVVTHSNELAAKADVVLSLKRGGLHTA